MSGWKRKPEVRKAVRNTSILAPAFPPGDLDGPPPECPTKLSNGRGAPKRSGVAHCATRRFRGLTSLPTRLGSLICMGALLFNPPIVMHGIASHMSSAFPAWYLAVPQGRGHLVTICARRCRTMRSTDAGPSKAMQRLGRVADLSIQAFTYVCECPSSMGLTRVTVTVR